MPSLPINYPNCGAPMEPVGNRNHLRGDLVWLDAGELTVPERYVPHRPGRSAARKFGIIRRNPLARRG